MNDVTPVAVTDPEIMGGKPCFPGTRVPVQMLFDSIAYGRTVDYFVDQYRPVGKEQILALLDRAGQLVRAEALAVAAAVEPVEVERVPAWRCCSTNTCRTS